jgi:hypothetical protein
MTEVNIMPIPIVTPTSSAPGDVLKAITEEKTLNDARTVKIQQASAQLEKERDLLQKHIHDNANPNPIIIVTLMVVILLFLWLMHILFMKPKICGVWRDISGNRIRIKKNILSNIATVHVNSKYSGYLIVLDNFIKYGDLVGVWDYSNTILFMDGIEWLRPI